MKKLLFVSLLTLSLSNVMAQKKLYSTTTGTTFFDAGTGVENISATNKSTTSVFDATSGQIQFKIMNKGFEFWSQLMQDHFNENYMESEKYPKSTFTGNITNISKVNFSKDGSYPVTVKGTLDMHGVKKEIETTGSFKVTGEQVLGTANFIVALEDYKIVIPGVVKDKLAKTVQIKISCNYNPLKQ
jgi:polyisoprenoid-binding protein YceI